MSHYFIADDTLKPNIRSFHYYHGAVTFEFTSDSGMFSPGHVDPATDLLIKAVPTGLTGSLLDLGCGYGVIGIVLGKVSGLDVTLADVNGRALAYAQKNCADNNITANIIESDCFQNIEGHFDHITLNPPVHAGKGVMCAMYEGAHAHLRPGGKFTMVIQEKHGAKSAVRKLAEIYGGCEILYKKKGYYVLMCKKYGRVEN